MNLSIFGELDQAKISQLTFIEQTVPFMFREAKDSPVIYGAVHMVSTETIDKLVTLFKGKDDVTISKNDKVYVFPGCSIPQFKIKQILRDIGARFVSNYKEATVFLGSNNAYKQSTDKEFSVTLLAGSYYNNMYLCNTPKHELAYPSEYKELYDNAVNYYCRGYNYAKDWPSCHELFRNHNNRIILHMLTILGAEIIHKKLSQKIPIISEKAFLKYATPSCVIDRDMYLSLNDMLQSSDEENYLPALQTIANCDIEQSKKYLFLLLKYNYNKFNNSRFKNIKLFNKMINLKEYEDASVRDFIIALINDNLDNISKDVARQLFENEAENYINSCENSDLFDIILVPKAKFKPVIDELTYKYELDDEHK